MHLPGLGCLYIDLNDIIEKTSFVLRQKRFFHGAGDEARTRYLHLGKVALYRMSYTRISRDLLYQLSGICQGEFSGSAGFSSVGSGFGSGSGWGSGSSGCSGFSASVVSSWGGATGSK